MVWRRRVAAVSALSVAAGGVVWVAMWTAGVWWPLATVLGLGTAFALASVAPWRVDRGLFGLALGYAFAFVLLESPLWIFLLLVFNPSPD